MKRRQAHNIYLSEQALDIFVALKTCAGNSCHGLPPRYGPTQWMLARLAAP